MGNQNKGEEKRTIKKKSTEKDDDDKRIFQDHPQFELAADMMHGIRHTVSLTSSVNMRRKARALANKNKNSNAGSHSSPSDNELFQQKNKIFFPSQGSSITAGHGQRDFKFRDYCPEIFAQLREWFGIAQEDYLTSVCGNFNLIEFISNSKSGEFFFYSHDRKFMIKTMPQSESKLLRQLLPSYFNYVSRQPHTLLTKFFGMHRVSIPGTSNYVYFMIMGSVFDSPKQIHRIYDLKGSIYNRLSEVPEDSLPKNKTVTLKDQNWANNDMRLEVNAQLTKLFKEQLRRDVEFLKKAKIMDYSLLVGIHNVNQSEENITEKAVVNEELPKVRSLSLPEAHRLSTGQTYSFKHKAKHISAKRPTDVGFSHDLTVLEKANELEAIEEEEMAIDDEEQLPQFEVNITNADPPTIQIENDELEEMKELEVEDREDGENLLRSDNPFTQHEGGMRSVDGGTIYFTGIIDILQLYNKAKKMERLAYQARPGVEADTVSCVPPGSYGKRLLNFIYPSVGLRRKQSTPTSRRPTIDEENYDD